MMTPKTKLTLRALTGALLLASASHAQTVPSNQPGEEVLELGTFEVKVEKDNGYQANNSVSATRVNEKLRNIPVALTVINEELMKDMAVSDYQQIAGFAPGVNTSGGPDNNDYNTTIRGLTNRFQMRNFFLWYSPGDLFNVERAEIIRGPSALLYGRNDAGGLINLSTKRAKPGTSGSIDFRLGSDELLRGSFDANYGNQTMALRVNGVYQDNEDWRNYRGRTMKAIAPALMFKPFASTTLRAEFEFGTRSQNIGGPVLLRTQVPLTATSNALNFAAGAYIPGATGGPTAFGTGVVAAATPVSGGVLVPAGTILPGANAVVAPSGGVLIPGGVYFPSGGAFVVSATSTVTIPAGGAYLATGGVIAPAGGLSVPVTARTGNSPPSILATNLPREAQFRGPDSIDDIDYHNISVFLEHQFSKELTVELAFNQQVKDNLVARFNNPNNQLTVPATGPFAGQEVVGQQYTRQIFKNDVKDYRLTATYSKDFGWTQQRLLLIGQSNREEFVAENYNFFNTGAAVAANAATGQAGIGALAYGAATRQVPVAGGDGVAATSLASFLSSQYPGATLEFRRQAGFDNIQVHKDDSVTAALSGKFLEQKLTTLVGARYDVYSFTLDAPQFVPAGLANAGDIQGHVYSALDKYKVWSHNAGFAYEVTAPVTLFANYSQGFIQNGGRITLTGDILEPQSSEGIEAGVKYELMNGRLSGYASVFDIDQINNAVADPDAPPGARAFIGGRDTNAKGFEVDFTANVVEGLTLNANYSYLKTKITRDAFRANVGREDFGAPNHSFNTFGRYTFKAGSLKGFFVGGGAQYRSEAIYFRTPSVLGNPAPASVVVGGITVPLPGATDSPDARADYTVPSYWQANFLAGYSRKVGKGTWRVAVNVNNIFDKNYLTVFGAGFAQYGNPRSFTVSNSFSF